LIALKYRDVRIANMSGHRGAPPCLCSPPRMRRPDSVQTGRMCAGGEDWEREQNRGYEPGRRVHTRMRPGRTGRLVRNDIRAFHRAWWARRQARGDWIPRPMDVPHAFSSGPDPDRLLLFGGGPAVGWGVVTHELGLAGFLTRALTGLTGRGADVRLLADPRLEVASAAGALTRMNLADFDAVVITLGVEDALRGIRLAAWRADLTRVLQQVRAGCSPLVPIFVAGVQPVRSIPAYDDPIAEPADRHAARMNEVTQTICREIPGVIFVPLPPDPESPSGPRRTPKNYPHWARLLAESIARAKPSPMTAAPTAFHPAVNIGS
jgi:lysophospholipase L1-like esterase